MKTKPPLFAENDNKFLGEKTNFDSENWNKLFSHNFKESDSTLCFANCCVYLGIFIFAFSYLLISNSTSIIYSQNSFAMERLK